MSRRRGRADIPARTPLSDALSKELRARGFSFVGSTIVYAFMQAAGLVNDHTLTCFRRPQVAALGAPHEVVAVAQAAAAEQHVRGQHRQLRRRPAPVASSARTPFATTVAP